MIIIKHNFIAIPTTIIMTITTFSKTPMTWSASKINPKMFTHAMATSATHRDMSNTILELNHCPKLKQSQPLHSH